ncbi:hypothetical protein [Klebsiella variicola]
MTTLATIGFAQMVSLTNWPVFYLCGALALLTVVVVLRRSV